MVKSNLDLQNRSKNIIIHLRLLRGAKYTYLAYTSKIWLIHSKNLFFPRYSLDVWKLSKLNYEKDLCIVDTWVRNLYAMRVNSTKGISYSKVCQLIVLFKMRNFRANQKHLKFWIVRIFAKCSKACLMMSLELKLLCCDDKYPLGLMILLVIFVTENLWDKRLCE